MLYMLYVTTLEVKIQKETLQILFKVKKDALDHAHFQNLLN